MKPYKSSIAQTVSSEGAEGGYYNSSGYWVPPEVVAMKFSKTGDRIDINGILYSYDSLRKEVRVTPPMESMGSMEHHFR